MADISDIRELAGELFLMNIANGVIDLDNETVSNKDYLYNVLKQELDLRAKRKADLLYKESGLPKKVFDESRITAGLRWQLEELKKIDFHNTKQGAYYHSVPPSPAHRPAQLHPAAYSGCPDTRLRNDTE